MSSALAAIASTQVLAEDASGPISPLYGKIAPFYGKIAPFYGKIAPFYGKIAPFYGKIAPFWSDTATFWSGTSPFIQSTAKTTAPPPPGAQFDPFWGSGPTNPYTTPNPNVTYSKIGGFWNSEAANWGTVQTAWSNAASDADFANLAKQLQGTILDPASSFWGKAILAKTKNGTLASVYSNALLSQAGVTFNANGSVNASSLRGVTETQQAVFFLGLYDNLMSLSGTGHVDWWMAATEWSPALAQTEGTIPDGGTAPTVGMIDFTISGGTKVSKQVTQFGSGLTDGHGAAVASLIMGSVDGSGILGVLPKGSVNVVVYNPYDDTGTTNWTDVGTGIAALSAAIFKDKTVPVGVLNASLGVPGWTLNPGWNDALALGNAHGHNLVIAAGNDGVTQTQNVPWNFDANPNLIIVGSVGVDGTISNFSNRPGEACLLPTSSASIDCTEANKLKNRFIVAPGELVLVSDGQGGFVRQSGTSLAAPLVSGAIALLQNRWPWLSNYPDETAQIILKSATPLGSQPGSDPDYGVGELNIKASQSPLNWAALQYYTVQNGKMSQTPVSASAALAQVANGSQASFDSSNLSFTVLEAVGATYRDFQIPLSSKLVGQKTVTGGGGQLYQSYLSSALRAQAGRFAGLAAAQGNVSGALGIAAAGVPAGHLGGMAVRFSMAPKEATTGFRNRAMPYEMRTTLASDTSNITFGFGEGAAVLDGHTGFGFHSDYELGRGGANPVLGLASGGSYLNAGMLVAPRLTVSLGATQRRDRRDLAAFGLSSGPESDGLRYYAARAEQIGLQYAASDALTLRSAITQLHEDSAVLGVQSVDRADFRGGSDTTAATMGFDLALPRGFSLTGSGTVGSTRLGGAQLETRSLGLISTAAELAIAKAHVFARTDSVRLALSKPLNVNSGSLRYDSVGVVDRETGTLGVISQSVNAANRTPYSGEIVYGHALARGEFSLFGRADANAAGTLQTISYTGGAQLSLAF